MDEKPKPSRNGKLHQLLCSQTPLVLFFLIAVSIFLVEVLIMLMLQSLRELAGWSEVFFDAALLVRPMRRYRERLCRQLECDQVDPLR